MSDWNNWHCMVAVKLLGCKEGRLLHPELVRFLNTQSRRLMQAGSQLLSRQVIAGLLATWECANPSTSPYDKEVKHD